MSDGDRLPERGPASRLRFGDSPSTSDIGGHAQSQIAWGEEGDFTWNSPNALAKSVGILPDGVNTTSFLRADIVLVSWAALEAELKGENQTLSQKLEDMNVFTPDTYNAAKLFVANNGGVMVNNSGAFEQALQNETVAVMQIGSDIDISSEISVIREDGPETLIYIRKGATLTISDNLLLVGFFIINDGTIVISGEFDRGLSSLINNNMIMIRDGGWFASGMTETVNYGFVDVDKGGDLRIERGTQFTNLGSITNNGYISVNDGGTLYNNFGAITNNGTIDLGSAFFGSIEDITGTGTVNDNRE